MESAEELKKREESIKRFGSFVIKLAPFIRKKDSYALEEYSLYSGYGTGVIIGIIMGIIARLFFMPNGFCF